MPIRVSNVHTSHDGRCSTSAGEVDVDEAARVITRDLASGTKVRLLGLRSLITFDPANPRVPGTDLTMYEGNDQEFAAMLEAIVAPEDFGLSR